MNPLDLIEMPKKKKPTKLIPLGRQSIGFNSYHTELVALNKDKKVELNVEAIMKLWKTSSFRSQLQDTTHIRMESADKVFKQFAQNALCKNIDKIIKKGV